MRAFRFGRLSVCLGAVAALIATTAAAQTETILYSFSSPVDPTGRFIQLKSGAIVGTTYYGGSSSKGGVYQLKEKGGSWKYKQVYSFTGSGGANPYDGLTIDKVNGIFGASQNGGANGYGTVFTLSPTQSGSWNQTVLHNFTGADGGFPEGVLIANSAADRLYGTTSAGSSSGCGNVFSIATGGSLYKVLYAFKGGNDGCHPQTGMAFGTDEGTFFGTTIGGGSYGQGTVFQMRKNHGDWRKRTVYEFTGGTDGGMPTDFRADANSNLFGVAAGGQYGEGVVFELERSLGYSQGKTIHTFGNGADGASPIGLHINLTTGTIYGSTETGGAYGQGTVYELTPSGGNWTETILHSFGGPGDGAYPVSRPIQDKATGNIYGTTNQGGQYGDGVIYMIVP